MSTITKMIGSGGDYTEAQAASVWLSGIAGASSGDSIVYLYIDAVNVLPVAFLSNPQGYAGLTLTSLVGSKIAPTNDTDSIITWGIADKPLIVEWMELTAGGEAKVKQAIRFAAGYHASTVNIIRHCKIHSNNAPFSHVAAIGGDNNGPWMSVAQILAHDNLIYDWQSSSTAHWAVGIYVQGAVANAYRAFNNTIDGIKTNGSGEAAGIKAYYAGAVDTICKNNVCTNCVSLTGPSAAFSNLAGAICNNNASDDATAPGAGSITNIVPGNTYNGDGDYRILNDSAAIYHAGVDLGAPYNVDLLGTTRTAPWSIGAYQDAVGGAPPATVEITDPIPFKSFKRTASAAMVTISGTYAGSPSKIEYRVDGGSWADLDTNLSGGMFSGTASVPQGTHSISVRHFPGTSITATVANVLIGDVYLVIGQSNASGRLTNYQTYSHLIQKASMWKGGAWSEVNDPTNNEGVSKGSPWPLLATQLMADIGVPVIFFNYAAGGTEIVQWWMNGPQAKWIAAKAAVAASGINGVTAVLIDLGEQDAVAGTSEATFNERLDGLANDVNATYGCKLVVAETGTVPGCDPANMAAIRAAQNTAWADNPNVQEGPIGSDRAGLHWETDEEGEAIAGRWYASITGNEPPPSGIPDGEYNGAALLFTIVNGAVTSIREAP